MDTGVWVGLDSTREQYKPEAREMLAVGAADQASEHQARIAYFGDMSLRSTHPLSTRCVSPLLPNITFAFIENLFAPILLFDLRTTSSYTGRHF